MKFNLRDKVKDPIKGITGIITSVSEYFTGCTRYGITTKPNIKMQADSKTHDCAESVLELVTAAKNPIMVSPKFDLGATLKDAISGRKGTVACRTYYIGEYWRYSLQLHPPKELKEIEEWIGFDEIQLQQVAGKPKVNISKIKKELKKKPTRYGPSDFEPQR